MTSSVRLPRDIYQDSFILSILLCSAILAGFLQYSEQFLHWFVIPITLCGIVMGMDAINWMFGRFNIFDPIGIIGLLGIHFFFLAPLLHIAWDAWFIGADLPQDWRPWLGYMGALNFLGLLIYRASRHLILGKPQAPPATVWTLHPRRFTLLLASVMALSATLQTLVYQKFGGILGYITAATDLATKQESFAGMGLTFLISETFPILSMMGFAVYARRHPRLQRWTVLILVLTLFLALQLLFGGLRGSRSNTIWALFWALGIIHFWVRTVDKKAVALGLVFLVFFMYLYGFFKGAGLDGVKTAFEGREARIALSEETGRSWEGMLLGDLARSDIQTFLLYRLMQPDSDYDYAWGRTYYSAALSPIPSAFLPDKPVSKSKEGTEAQYGMGTYSPDYFVSSKVYGLAGEAMLNFGPLAVPMAFIVLGLAVGSVQRYSVQWQPSDARLLVLPMLINMCFIILVGDMDNVLFFLVKNGGLPTLVVFLSSQRVRDASC